MYNELYHYGVKGMKWDPDKRPHSRKRNDNGKTGEVHRREEGLGFSSPHAGSGSHRRVPGRKKFGAQLFYSKIRRKRKP